MKAEKKISINYRMSKETHSELKRFSAISGASMQKVIDEAVYKHITPALKRDEAWGRMGV